MGMIPNPNPTMVITLLFGVSVLVFIMLLPALLELKRPRDSGPRTIMDDAPIIQHLKTRRMIPLESIEEEKFRLDQTILKKIADVIAVLPTLET